MNRRCNAAANTHDHADVARGAPLPLHLPPSMPQFPDRAWRHVIRGGIRANGWRFEGELPDISRAVLIAAPHSSWWDGVHGLLFKLALGADIAFMVKRELFFWPLNVFLRKLGGVSVERGAAHGVVEQMRERFRAHEKLWLAIAPEGTRKHVVNWKSGFWHIARDAGVPIVPVYFDYPRKLIGVGAVFHPGADRDADLAALRAFYAPYQGKYRGVD